MSKDNQYKRQDDVQVSSIKIYSDAGGVQEIKKMVLGFSIYESLDGSFMTATLDMVDNIGFATKFPVIGQESVEIIYRTPGFGYRYTTVKFDVMKVGKRTKSQQGSSEYYQLSCISPNYIDFTTSRIDRSFKGTASSSIKNLLLENGSKLGNIDGSKYRSVWVIPSFTLHESLKYFTSRCRGYLSNMSDFILFESSYGWNCRSVTGLFAGRSKITYRLEPPELPLRAIEEFPIIKEFQVRSYYNRYTEMEKGLHACRIVTFDWTKKTENHSMLGSDDIYVERRKTSSNLEDYRNLPVKNRYDQKFDARVFFRHQSSGLHEINEVALDSNISTNEDDSLESIYTTRTVLDKYNHPNDFKTHLLSRQLSSRGFNPIRVWISVSGNSGLNVGDVVSLQIPSPEIPSKKKQDNIDKSISGRYVITNIRQEVKLLSDYQFTSFIELGRDTSPMAVPDENTFLGTDKFTVDNMFGGGGANSPTPLDLRIGAW